MGQTVNLLSYDFGGSNPPLPTKPMCKLANGKGANWFVELKVLFIYIFANFQICKLIRVSSSFGRATAFQAVGGEFEPRLPLMFSKQYSS